MVWQYKALVLVIWDLIFNGLSQIPDWLVNILSPAFKFWLSDVSLKRPSVRRGRAVILSAGHAVWVGDRAILVLMLLLKSLHSEDKRKWFKNPMNSSPRLGEWAKSIFFPDQNWVCCFPSCLPNASIQMQIREATSCNSAVNMYRERDNEQGGSLRPTRPARTFCLRGGCLRPS